jgi:hypothetical protein
MQLAAATQRLSCTRVPTLASVMHEQHRTPVRALKLAQIREQRCDLVGRVLVDAVQPDERIEHQEPRPQSSDGLAQRVTVGLVIEAQARRRDHVQRERIELDARGRTDAHESLSHDVQRVLGCVQQHRARLGDREATQRRAAGSDRDGEIESQERLAALGLAAHDAHGLLSPQLVEQEASRRRPGLELRREAHGQSRHRLRRRSAAARPLGSLVAVEAEGLKTSK